MRFLRKVPFQELRDRLFRDNFAQYKDQAGADVFAASPSVDWVRLNARPKTKSSHRD